MLLKQLSLKIRIKDRSFRNNVYFMFYDTYSLIEKKYSIPVACTIFSECE